MLDLFGIAKNLSLNAQPRAPKSHSDDSNTGSQGRRAKTLSRALDADSEAAPVGRAAGERGRRSIAELGERLQRLRFVRTLLPAIERLLHPPRQALVLGTGLENLDEWTCAACTLSNDTHCALCDAVNMM